jgi:undecaprenyl-diphosphatase
MNPFDREIILFLNSFARRSWTVDWLAWLLDSNYLVKGAVIAALLTWAWFRRDPGQAERRARLVAGLLASCAAVVFARALSFVLPFRGRPIYNPVLHFVPPYSVDGMNLTGWWTSFPSDNAVLFFALAMCVWSVSRRAGWLAFLHVSVVVGIARVYVGYHHPTDILAGAGLGIGIVWLAQTRRARAVLTRMPMYCLDTRPEWFYPALFALLLCVSTVFDPVFSMGHIVRTIQGGVRVATPADTAGDERRNAVPIAKPARTQVVLASSPALDRVGTATRSH